MAINKKTREAVYRKYGGRCAYCGRAIAYKDKPVAACWQETSAPRRQWKIVHKYKVEYRSPVSNKELLKKSYVWAVSAEEAVGYAKENVGISGLIVNAEESNESDS